MTAALWPVRSRAGTDRGRLGRLPPGSTWSVGIPALAAALVTAGILLGWRGGDLPAQIYRSQAVLHHGLALWDSQWFAGNWTLGYSVAYPALASVVGLGLLSVISAAVAAAGFDRLVAAHFARGPARAASVVFAVSLIVETAIGQLPFLAGEATGLWCCVAFARRRPLAMVAAAVATSLLSPLAGAFVALAGGAWLLATWFPALPAVSVTSRVSRAGRPVARGVGVLAGLFGTSDRCPPATHAPAVPPAPSGRLSPGRLRRPGVGLAVGMLAAIAVPVGIAGVLFPGQGPMPYPVVDLFWELVVAGVLWSITPRTQPVLRSGIIVFVVAAIASECLPSALGGNVGRIEDCVAVPLTVALLWPRRRVLLGLLLVPLVLSQWGPAWAPMTSNAGHPWTHQAYYRPLVGWLHRVDAAGPQGRVEVVPTAEHWEAAYVAPAVPLARGWERQLDIADDPIFYTPGALTPAGYRAWLVDNGVRYVALPSAPLDYAGQAEGRLVGTGAVPGLRLVARVADWRVYRVQGAPGIVSGPGYLASMEGGRFSVVATGAGRIEVRVHDNPSWQVVSGPATIDPVPSASGWILLDAVTPGVVRLQLGSPTL